MEKSVLSGKSIQVYNYICKQIFSGKICQGDVINENELANACGTSRTPVRNALKQLENDGLVEAYQNKFVRVIEMSDDDIKHLGEARLVLELIISKLVMYHGSNAEFVQLQRVEEESKEGIKSDSLYEKVNSDSKFLLELARLSNNEVLVSFMKKILMFCSLVQIDKFADIGVAERQEKNHEALIQALIKRDMKAVNESLVKGLVDFYNIDKEVIFMIFSNGNGLSI